MALNPTGTMAYFVDMGGKLYIMDLEAQTLAAELETGVKETKRAPLDSNIEIISGGYCHSVVDLGTP